MSGTGETMHSAAARGRVNDLQMLLVMNRGRRAVDVADIHGHTPLMCAIIKGGDHAPILVERLLKEDPDLLLKDKQGRTALEHAAIKGNPEVMELLLPFIKSKEVLLKAYTLAEANHQVGCANLIKAHVEALDAKASKYGKDTDLGKPLV